MAAVDQSTAGVENQNRFEAIRDGRAAVAEYAREANLVFLVALDLWPIRGILRARFLRLVVLLGSKFALQWRAGADKHGTVRMNALAGRT